MVYRQKNALMKIHRLCVAENKTSVLNVGKRPRDACAIHHFP